MAKRFIDTEIFKKKSIRNLKASHKLFWIYILNDCNHAGIWEVDMEVAQLRLDVKISEKEILHVFKEKIVILNGGSKWFIPDFITFQYGELKENNKAHKNIISLLKKENLLSDDLNPKPLPRGIQGASEAPKEMEMEMDKEKEMEKDQEKGGMGGKLLEKFKDSYDEFIKKKTGVKPKYDGVQINAAKSIIAYLNGLETIIDDEQILRAWQYILSHWQKLDEYQGRRIKLNEISSDIMKILDQIKNPKPNGKQAGNSFEQRASKYSGILGKTV